MVRRLLQLESLEDRTCLSGITPNGLPVNITYGGGPVITSPMIFNIFANGDPNYEAYIKQESQVIASQYLPLLGPAYGVGKGIVNGSIDISTASGPIPNSFVQQQITQLITSGKSPPPEGNQIYNYFLPPGTVISDVNGNGISGIAGYHSSYTLNGQNIYYTVNYNGITGLTLQQEGMIPAHEDAETATDPGPPTGYYDHNPADFFTECADFLMWNQNYFFQLNGFIFSACVDPNGVPIVPTSQLPLQPIQQSQQVIPQQSPQQVITEIFSAAIDEFQVLEYGLLARFLPQFAANRDVASAALASNPILDTQFGPYAILIGEATFITAINGPA